MQSLRLVAFSVSAAQLSGWTAGAPCEADGDCPAPPEVLAKKPACSLVGRVSLGLQLPLSSPYGSGCLSLAGDGLQRAFSVQSFVRIGQERPMSNQKDLTWASKPDCGITTARKART